MPQTGLEDARLQKLWIALAEDPAESQIFTARMREPMMLVWLAAVWCSRVGVDTRDLMTRECCAGHRESLLREREEALEEIGRLEAEMGGIEAEWWALVKQKKERGFSRYTRVMEGRKRRDAEVKRIGARIAVLRVQISWKEDGMRREEQTRNERLARLQGELQRCFCTPVRQNRISKTCREADGGQEADTVRQRLEEEKARLEGEIVELERGFVVQRDAENKEIRAGEDEIRRCREEMRRMEGELTQLQWMTNEERRANESELAAERARYCANAEALGSLLRSWMERLTAIDDGLERVDWRMHELEA